MRIILPTSHFTDVLSEKQLEWLVRHLPEPTALTGRPAYPNRILLSGVLKVLRSGCRWRDLNVPGFPSGVTYWRRFRLWERHRADSGESGDVYCPSCIVRRRLTSHRLFSMEPLFPDLPSRIRQDTPGKITGQEPRSCR